MKIQVIQNEKMNGVELYMDSVPDTSQKNKLKGFGYKFHRNKSCWYISSNNYCSSIIEELEAETGDGLTIHDILTKSNKISWIESEKELNRVELSPPKYKLEEPEGEGKIFYLNSEIGIAYTKFWAKGSKNRGLLAYIKAHGTSNWNGDSYLYSSDFGDVLLTKCYGSGFRLYSHTVPTQYKVVKEVGARAFSKHLNDNGFETIMLSDFS